MTCFLSGLRLETARNNVSSALVVGYQHAQALDAESPAHWFGITLFLLLPAFFIRGAFDCARAKPGIFCSIVRLAFDDTPGRL